MPLSVPTKSELLRRIYLRLSGKSIPITDMTTISAMRIFLEEAILEEILDLYAGVVSELQAWFIQSATGADLDRRLADYNFARVPGNRANGTVSFTAAGGDASVPAGTLLRRIGDDSTQFAVQPNPLPGSNGAWPVLDGTTAPVTVAAVAVGTKYNIPANSLELVNTITNISGVANVYAFVNGTEANNDADTVQAFWRFLLHTGANRASIQDAILNHTDPASGVKPVHSIAFQEWDGNELLSIDNRAVSAKIYVEDGSGTASLDLLTALTTLLEGNDTVETPGIRAAGTPIAVVSATPFLIPVTVAVDIVQTANATQTQDNVIATIQQFLGRLPISGSGLYGDQGDLRFAELFKAVVDVENVLRATFTFPIGDINVPFGSKCMPGSIQVSAHAVL